MIGGAAGRVDGAAHNARPRSGLRSRSVHRPKRRSGWKTRSGATPGPGSRTPSASCPSAPRRTKTWHGCLASAAWRWAFSTRLRGRSGSFRHRRVGSACTRPMESSISRLSGRPWPAATARATGCCRRRLWHRSTPGPCCGRRCGRDQLAADALHHRRLHLRRGCPFNAVSLGCVICRRGGGTIGVEPGTHPFFSNPEHTHDPQRKDCTRHRFD